MTDFTTDVTVTIHGTEMDLVAVGDAICPAEPDVGIMRPYIHGCDLTFADGTPAPREWYDLILAHGDWEKVCGALDDALARGDFEPDPDHRREDREDWAAGERRRLGLMLGSNPFKPKQS